MFDRKRRDFITLLGVAATWPLLARAQQPGRMRRIGVLMSTAADDARGQARSAAFTQGLQQLGWEVGSNIRIDYRWGAGDTERFRKYAAELVALRPDVILGTAASIVTALQQASRTIPIVFVSTIDPVGAKLGLRCLDGRRRLRRKLRSGGTYRAADNPSTSSLFETLRRQWCCPRHFISIFGSSA
jgi:hypothetical protein